MSAGVETLAAAVVSYGATVLVRGALVLGAAWLVLRVMPRLAPAARARIGRFALLVAVMSPLIPGVDESLSVAVDTRLVEVGRRFEEEVVLLGSERLVAPCAPTDGTTLGAVSPPPVARRAGHRSLTLPAGAWVDVAAVALLLGVSFGLGRTFGGWAALRRRARRASPAPATLTSRLRAWRTRVGTRRPVTLRLTDASASPQLAGLGRATVLLPSDLVAGLTDGELDQVLAHELVHAARRDDVARLVDRVVGALLWFHPLLRPVERLVDEATEMAADARAAALTGSRRAYAESLLRVALLAGPDVRSPQLAPGAVMSRSSVARRIAGLGAPRTAPRPWAWIAVVSTLVATPLVPSIDVDGAATGTRGSSDASTALGWFGFPGASDEVDVVHRDGRRFPGAWSTDDGRPMLRVRASWSARGGALEPGSRFELLERGPTRTRSWVRTAGADGTLHTEVFDDGAVVPFDDEARRWLVRALEQLAADAGHPEPSAFPWFGPWQLSAALNGASSRAER